MHPPVESRNHLRVMPTARFRRKPRRRVLEAPRSKAIAEDADYQNLVNLQSDLEDRIAIGLRIVSDGGRHCAALDEKLQRLLREIGQPGDARLAVAIGADFHLRLALIQESVLDDKADLGVKNRFARAVFHKEIRAAGAQAGVNHGNFRRVRSEGSAERNENEDRAQKENGPNLPKAHFDLFSSAPKFTPVKARLQFSLCERVDTY